MAKINSLLRIFLCLEIIGGKNDFGFIEELKNGVDLDFDNNWDKNFL